MMRCEANGCFHDSAVEISTAEIFKALKLVHASRRAECLHLALKKLREWAKDHPSEPVPVGFVDVMR